MSDGGIYRDGFQVGADGMREILKDPAADLPYSLHWYDWLRGDDGYWNGRIIVQPGETYTPPASGLNGHRYRCTIGGRTGSTPPTWPTVGTSPFTDGGVTWVRIGLEDTISAATVTAETGLTATAVTIDSTGTLTTFTLSGGTAGRDYIVTVDVDTTAGHDDQRRFRVLVRER